MNIFGPEQIEEFELLLNKEKIGLAEKVMRNIELLLSQCNVEMRH